MPEHKTVDSLIAGMSHELSRAPLHIHHMENGIINLSSDWTEEGMALMVVIAPEELANFEFWSGMDITDLSLETDMMVVVRYRDLPGNGQVTYTQGKGARWAREREEEPL